MKILLTGIAGRLGRQVAAALAGEHQVVGIDKRPCLGLPAGVQHYRYDIRHRPAEALFEGFLPDAVVHLGVVHNFRMPAVRLLERNLSVTTALLQLLQRHKTAKLVLLSSGDVYGPEPTNSHYIREDAPLIAAHRFPELDSVVAVDRAVQAFFWRHPEVATVILRPAHIVGPHVRNAPANFLRLQITPTVLGFDPIVQFCAEQDVIQAIQLALQPAARGIFNLASTQPVPLSIILKRLKKPVLPLPHFLFRVGLGTAWRWRFTSFPAAELDHLRFNSVLDTTEATEKLGFVPSQTLDAILQPFTVSTSPGL